MVFMPPRHGKSERISKYFPAWLLGNYPEKRVMLSSYEASFAASWGGKARNVLEESGHYFGVKVSSRSSAADWWEIEGSMGGMVTAGVGGPLTGKGADVLVIDDPLKNAEEAASKTIRDKQWDWYQSTAYTRLEPSGAVILVMTRWHEDDLAGRLLDEEKHGGDRWDKLSMPAIDDTGNALWPARFDLQKLEAIKKTVGSYYWEAMYQQRPAPLEGGLIKRAWWKYYTVLPKVQRFIWSWDTAVKVGQDNDFSVGTLWAECEDGFYLCDLIRAKMEYPELKQAIRAAYNKVPSSVILVEDKSSGQQIIQELRKDGKLPVIDFKTDKDKVLRVNLISPTIQAGHVYLPESAPFVSDFVEECAGFPNAVHDDQVDSMTQFLLYSTSNPAPVGFYVGGIFQKGNRPDWAGVFDRR
jgi:predicted phage terminase large subunit-like protein